MHRFSSALAALLCPALLFARQDRLSCGAHPDKAAEEYHLHVASEHRGEKRVRRASQALLPGERRIGGVAVRPDIGNIAILDDSDGVVARRNPFNLNSRTVRFLPQNSAATAYRFEVAADTYDSVAAGAGVRVEGLGDDDFRTVPLPFSFPFFGSSYRTIFVNSDGNLTFNQGDGSSSDRSLGRVTSGEPRIAALFTDLDPTRGSGGVFTTSSANSFIISWVAVPEYRSAGAGPLQTFQIRLFPDGRIETAWTQVTSLEAVVGIAPGRLRGATSVVSFANTPSAEYTAAVAERFTGEESIDIFAAAQKFYLNHDDSYDFLVFYNNLGINADEGAVAYEVTVRNNRSGYGDRKADSGYQTGSARRLQALANMGPLSQYPKDPDGRVPARLSVGDTPVTTIAHEAGHLFLAYASVRDEDGGRPMLGGQAMAHWRFTFNSEASLLEGNRIQDNGPGASPRFQTVATVEAYSALDQYLMGLRSAEEVPDTFYVADARGSTGGLPRVGATFDGERRDVRIADLIAAEGRRIPDHTVAQQRFRFAFILVTAAGKEAPAEDVAQLELYRERFADFFNKATSARGIADTTLKGALRLSLWPAAGVVAGSRATGAVALQQAAETPVTVLLRTSTGNVSAPASVVIPAGATEARFEITGLRSGTDELTAEPADARFETVHARVQVSNSESVRVAVESGDKQAATPGVALAQPVRIRVTDANELPYAGVPVAASLAGGGRVDQTSAVTDENGLATFHWTPGSGTVNELRASIAGGSSAVATALGRPAVARNAVVNAASYAAGLTPGGIGTMFGTNFGANTVTVLLNRQPVPVFHAGTNQINFHVPHGTQTGTAELLVRTEVGTSEPVQAQVTAVQPGIFFDPASGYGAVVAAGSGQWSQVRPIRRGEFMEIYATGLGEVQFAPDGNRVSVAKPSVTIGGVPAPVQFSGLTPGFVGLYQVNVQVPPEVPTGTQTVVISAGGTVSNAVRVEFR